MVRRHVVDDLVEEIKFAQQTHVREAPSSMVATALMAHTGLSFQQVPLRNRGSDEVYVLANGKSIASGMLFTLPELERALSKAGINSRKK